MARSVLRLAGDGDSYALILMPSPFSPPWPRIRRFPFRYAARSGLLALVLSAMPVGWWVVHAAPALPPLPEPRPRDRILILSPHPDDETLACGGLIRRAVERGADVRVVVLTSGDSFSVIAHRLFPKEEFSPALFARLGETRMRETRRALARLGLSSSRVTFLGYPDGGLEKLWSVNWSRPLKAYRTRTIRSPYGRRDNPDAVYSGESLLADLEAQLGQYRPTALYYPHPGDFNRDHRTAAAFTLLALNRLKSRPGWKPPREAAYLVHWGRGWPWPFAALTTAPMSLPPPMLHPSERWRTLSLNRDEALRKRAALTDYRSQYASRREGHFLNSFARKTETFSVKPRSRPSPAGTSIYEPVGSAHADPFTEASDLTGVRVAAEKARLSVRFRLQAPPTPDLLFLMEARTLEPSGRTRWISEIWTPGNPPSPACRATGKSVEWGLPLARLGNARSVLLSVATIRGRKELDRSAWTLWALPEKREADVAMKGKSRSRRRS